MELGKPVLKWIGIYDCTICRICARSCPKNALRVEPNNKDFILRVNLVGQLTMEEILEQSKLIFESKLDDLINKVEEAIREQQQTES